MGGNHAIEWNVDTSVQRLVQLRVGGEADGEAPDAERSPADVAGGGS